MVDTFLVVVGRGAYILCSGGWCWVYFRWWCMVVGLFWMVVGGSG